ncbi:MAG: hypothetical protein KDA20_09860 [Phycisphaerales bacterium]|nr:hypothetical protein [Phycisphaerales bacterium]
MTSEQWKRWMRVARQTVRVVAVMAAAGAATAIAHAQATDTEPAAAEAQSQSDELWVRTAQSRDRKLRMEVACRLYERPGGGPKVMLAGAVHVGDKPFYKKLQDILDANDVVLYEGVSPPGSERSVPASEAQRKELTNARLRLLATMAHQVETDGAQVTSLDALRAGLAGHTRALGWLDAAQRDAWGNQIQVFAQDDGTIDVRSAGPNGHFEPTRTDSDDMYFSDQQALSPEELGETPGIQQKLAKSLGLVFQLDEMDSDHAHWRNVDMSAAELEQRFAAAGLTEEGDGLFAMLEGTGLPAKLMGLVLGIIEHFPGAQPRAKMMLMDMLTHADDLMELAGVPGMEDLMRVIIEDRNKVVIDELARLVDMPDAPETIGIVYGAGHMPDLEQRMFERLGYKRTKERWLPAIEIDLEREGITRLERAMMKRQLEMQLEMMRKQAQLQRPSDPV